MSWVIPMIPHSGHCRVCVCSFLHKRESFSRLCCQQLLIPTPREVGKAQLIPRPHLPELSSEDWALPGMADKEVNDVLRSLGIRHHDVKNMVLFCEGVTEVRFVLNVKVGLGKHWPLSPADRQIHSLHTQWLFPPPVDFIPITRSPSTCTRRPSKHLRLVNISTVWF